MSKEEILTKLQKLFASHNPLPEEAHVLYLMVEARKIIDQDKSAERYPLLKFYADWMVHSQKDKITPEIKKISEEMYSFAVTEIRGTHLGGHKKKSSVLEFAYMEALREEMATFFSGAGIATNMATNKSEWVNFISLLVKILENQPINNPSANVKTIIFEPASPGCMVLTIEFNAPIEEYPSFTLANAY